MIRIGDTEAPLLAVIPFNPKKCNILTEKTFKSLMYVNVKSDYLSQIDIGIYDGNGKLIPFRKDVVTTLKLHFRKSPHANTLTS